jgi:hypothetical protein
MPRVGARNCSEAERSIRGEKVVALLEAGVDWAMAQMRGGHMSEPHG